MFACDGLVLSYHGLRRMQVTAEMAALQSPDGDCALQPQQQLGTV